MQLKRMLEVWGTYIIENDDEASETFSARRASLVIFPARNAEVLLSRLLQPKSQTLLTYIQHIYHATLCLLQMCLN